ncbi:hypothetical protein BI343_03685 [Chromobacterium amazonense]|nr:hypothetical protein BI343_03685 [Chromobacterium amazonense]
MEIFYAERCNVNQLLHQAGIISVPGITASIDDALRQVGKWIVSLLPVRFWAGRLMGMQSHSLMFGRRACALGKAASRQPD